MKRKDITKVIKKVRKNKNVFKNAESIDEALEGFEIDYNIENVYIICLSPSLEIIKTELLFKGGFDSCTFDPKVVFKTALLNNASRFIIAHNHPSGNINPSKEDKKVFKELKKIGKIMTLHCLDSIIFDKDHIYSIASDL